MTSRETMVVTNASDHDDVMIEVLLHDDTFDLSGPMPRWKARLKMLLWGTWGEPYGPYKKIVREATILEYQDFDIEYNVKFTDSDPVH